MSTRNAQHNSAPETVKVAVLGEYDGDRCEFRTDAGLLHLAMLKSSQEGKYFGEWLADLLADATADMTV